MNKKTMTAVILTAALLFAIPVVLGEYTKSSDADSVTEVSDYDGLLSAIWEGGNVVEIRLTADLSDVQRIEIKDGKEVTIDLNEHSITFRNSSNESRNYFEISNGSLTLTGTGTVQEGTNPYFAPVMLRGGAEETTTSGYSLVEVGENVTLRGWAGVFINVSAKDIGGFGSKAIINGNIESLKDKDNDVGAGVYVNGNVNGSEIEIGSTAEITSKGLGMYLAGVSETTIATGAQISGEETGIEIRAGSLTVNGGIITGGAMETEVTPNGNGSTTIGAGIAVAQHTTNKGVAVTINGGVITGYTAFIQKNPQNANGDVELSVTGGEFATIGGGAVAIFSENCKKFIVGGSFSDLDSLEFLGSDAIIDIVLNHDYEVTSVVPKDSAVTLDLNGHEISTTGTKSVISIDNGGTLKIKDSGSGGSIVYSGGSVTGAITTKGELNLEKCILHSVAYGVYVADSGSLNSCTGVSITATYSAISGNGTQTGANIIITGGVYTSETTASIFFPSTTSLKVTGGTFIGKTGFDIRAGTVEIFNATIKVDRNGTIDSTGSSGPSSWGMGIAVFDHSSYSTSVSEIKISVNDVGIEGAIYDIYIGGFKRNSGTSSFDDTVLSETYTAKHSVSVKIDDKTIFSSTKDETSYSCVYDSASDEIVVYGIIALENALASDSVDVRAESNIPIEINLEIPDGVTLIIPEKVTLTLSADGVLSILAGGSIHGIMDVGGDDVLVNIVTVGPNGKVALSAISDGAISAEGCSDVKYSIVPNSGYRYSGTGTLVNHGKLGNVSFSAVPPVDPVPPVGPDVEETVKTDGTHTETTRTTTDPDGTVTVETSITDSATGVTTSASTGSAIETAIPATASVSADGTAGIVIDDAAVEAAIRQIAMAAEATGTESAPVIRIAVETDDAATGLSVEIPASSLRDLADMGATVTVSSGAAVVTLDPGAASTIGSAGEGDVRIGIGEASKDDLSAAQKDVVGDKMVIRIDATAGDNAVHQLNGKATLSVPYTLKPGEDPDDIVIWYIDDDGMIENITAMYADGFVTWEMDHFSFYAVAFELGSNPSDSDMTLVYVAAVAIAIVVIAVIAYVIWKRSASA